PSSNPANTPKKKKRRHYVVGVPRRRAPPPRRLFVEVYALSQRCAPSSATFRAPVSLARFRASAAAASPPSRITSRRFLASQSSVAPSEICPDENLKRLIGNEIDRVFLPAEASAKVLDFPNTAPAFSFRCDSIYQLLSFVLSCVITGTNALIPHIWKILGT
uniref:Uncharacterized protein n=1 Tax=Aegilops tauschii subsp. strangulata TaxID=200361 RepID=A0A452ZJX0_AEGTS